MGSSSPWTLILITLHKSGEVYYTEVSAFWPMRRNFVIEVCFLTEFTGLKLPLSSYTKRVNCLCGGASPTVHVRVTDHCTSVIESPSFKLAIKSGLMPQKDS